MLMGFCFICFQHDSNLFLKIKLKLGRVVEIACGWIEWLLEFVLSGYDLINISHLYIVACIPNVCFYELHSTVIRMEKYRFRRVKRTIFTFIMNPPEVNILAPTSSRLEAFRRFSVHTLFSQRIWNYDYGGRFMIHLRHHCKLTKRIFLLCSIRAWKSTQSFSFPSSFCGSSADKKKDKRFLPSRCTTTGKEQEKLTRRWIRSFMHYLCHVSGILCVLLQAYKALGIRDSLRCHIREALHNWIDKRHTHPIMFSKLHLR